MLKRMTSDSFNDRPLDDLLSAAKAGDAEAREKLLAESRSYLGVIAGARMEPWMRAKFDASDLIQQTLVEAHEALEQFDGDNEAAWKAWLKKMMQHNVQDAVRHYKQADKRDIRRERRADASNDDGQRMQIAGDDPTSSRLAANEERDQELLLAVAALPEDYRRVLTLRTVEKRPFDEVAATMERTVPATQMLWTRAVRKLEEALRDRSELAD